MRIGGRRDRRDWKSQPKTRDYLRRYGCISRILYVNMIIEIIFHPDVTLFSMSDLGKRALSNLMALFDSLPAEDYKGGLLVLGGDGRYFNKEAAQVIIKIAAGNGVDKILVGRDGIMSTPAVSAVIRRRKENGGFIMSASHNPGGPDYDWGIKFNYSSGQPAPESITDQIYGNTLSISEIKMADIPDIDLSSLGMKSYGSFSVEVVDPVADYLELMEEVFDFQLVKDLLSRPDFRSMAVSSPNKNGSRIIFRLSGPGSAGAIIRMHIEWH